MLPWANTCIKHFTCAKSHKSTFTDEKNRDSNKLGHKLSIRWPANLTCSMIPKSTLHTSLSLWGILLQEKTISIEAAKCGPFITANVFTRQRSCWSGRRTLLQALQALLKTATPPDRCNRAPARLPKQTYHKPRRTREQPQPVRHPAGGWCGGYRKEMVNYMKRPILKTKLMVEEFQKVVANVKVTNS